MSPSASDIMIKRYDVQDVQMYRADHLNLVAGSNYTGAALVGFSAAGALVVISDVEDVIIGLLIASVVFLCLSVVCLYRLKRGASA